MRAKKYLNMCHRRHDAARTTRFLVAAECLLEYMLSRGVGEEGGALLGSRLVAHVTPRHAQCRAPHA